LNPNPSDELVDLRARVVDYRKQAQVLLERFQRGELSRTDVDAEVRRIEAEVAESERRVDGRFCELMACSHDRSFTLDRVAHKNAAQFRRRRSH